MSLIRNMRIATPCAAVLFLAGCALVFCAAGCSTQSIRKDQVPSVNVVEDDPVVIASIGFGRPGMTFPQPLRLSDFYGWPPSSWAGHSVAEYVDSLEDEGLKALIRLEIGEHYFEPVDLALYDCRCLRCASQEEVGDRVIGPEVPVEGESESRGVRCTRPRRMLPTIANITKRGIMQYYFEDPDDGIARSVMLSHLYLGDGAPTGHAPEEASRPQEQPVPVETIEAAGGVPTRPEASVIVEGAPSRVRRNIGGYLECYGEFQMKASSEDLGFVHHSWRDFQ